MDEHGILGVSTAWGLFLDRTGPLWLLKGNFGDPQNLEPNSLPLTIRAAWVSMAKGQLLHKVSGS